jgi:hypothetical protein
LRKYNLNICYNNRFSKEMANENNWVALYSTNYRSNNPRSGF